MSSKRLFGVFVIVLALIAAACGGRSDDTETADESTTTTSAAPADDDTAGDDDAPADDDTAEETTTTEGADPCDGVTLEATETGVTAETITVVAMADVESPLAPGLFEGAWLGVEAWAEHVNAEGGVGCRQIVVERADSMLNPLETENGFLKACNEALALVGTTVLFGTGTGDLNTCEDAAGNPIGVPDLAYITTEPPHQCSPNSFHVSRPGGACPYESGPRDFAAQVGAVRWIMDQASEPLHGVFLVPADLPSTIAASVPQIDAQAQLGIVFDDTVGVSGTATQAEYSPIVQTMQESGSNFVYNGSNDQAMIKMRSEAEATGLDASTVQWVCSLSCYTPDFIDQGGEVVEDTYVWMSFVPFDETDANAELADFIDAIGDPFPPAWAAGAWADGVLFEDVIDAIVERDGPNGITRQAMLDQLRTITDFDANGWWSTSDFTTTQTIAECIAILQVQDGEYVRVFPETPGELACDPSYRVDVTSDVATFEG